MAIAIYQIAISNQTGMIGLNTADGDSMAFISRSLTEENISVETDMLDRLLRGQSISNLMLAKMDIEGAELLALQGAISLLKQRHPPVWIVEINSSVNNFGYTQQDVVNFLNIYGYKLYAYDSKTNKIIEIDLSAKLGNNVLAIADTALDLVRDRLTGLV